MPPLLQLDATVSFVSLRPLADASSHSRVAASCRYIPFVLSPYLGILNQVLLAPCSRRSWLLAAAACLFSLPPVFSAPCHRLPLAAAYYHCLDTAYATTAYYCSLPPIFVSLPRFVSYRFRRLFQLTTASLCIYCRSSSQSLPWLVSVHCNGISLLLPPSDDFFISRYYCLEIPPLASVHCCSQVTIFSYGCHDVLLFIVNACR